MCSNCAYSYIGYLTGSWDNVHTDDDGDQGGGHFFVFSSYAPEWVNPSVVSCLSHAHTTGSLMHPTRSFSWKLTTQIHLNWKLSILSITLLTPPWQHSNQQS